jgi:hypothetical protein
VNKYKFFIFALELEYEEVECRMENHLDNHLKLPKGRTRMKNSIVLDGTPCSPLKGSRHFRGTCSLCVQDRRISHGRNQREAGSKQSLGLHGVISQKIKLFVTSTVKTSNPIREVRLVCVYGFDMCIKRNVLQGVYTQGIKRLSYQQC